MNILPPVAKYPKAAKHPAYAPDATNSDSLQRKGIILAGGSGTRLPLSQAI